MWLVRLALRRPYTIAVSCFLIMLLGVLSVTRMTVDIFPVINIPVVIVVWNYPGLSAQDMERRVVLISERGYSTTVNGISRIESQSISGIGLLKVYFQPGTDIGGAIAQISSVSSTILRIAPPGITPPSVIQFSATNVPVAQLTVSSATLPEQQLYDYGLNFIRVRLFTIPGLSTPAPFGGKERQIIVNLNPQALAAKGLSAGDAVAADTAPRVDRLPPGDLAVGLRNAHDAGGQILGLEHLAPGAAIGAELLDIGHQAAQLLPGNDQRQRLPLPRAELVVRLGELRDTQHRRPVRVLDEDEALGARVELDGGISLEAEQRLEFG